MPEISPVHCRAAITAEVGSLSRVTVTGLVLDDCAIREAIYEAG